MNAILFLLSLALGHTLAYNARPIIGVVSQKRSGSHSSGGSYIAASYVKYLESAGARVVPILNNSTEEEMKELFGYINGVLFPGGGVDLSTSGYGEVGEMVFRLAIEAKDKGDYFPVWGTCLGFELLSFIQSGNDSDLLSFVDATNLSLPLNFTKAGTSGSRLFSKFSSDEIEWISTEPITFNSHHFSVSTEKFNSSPKLNQFFSVLSTNKDRKGVEFVSSMEAKDYPIYGVQFHPEKNGFEWVADSEAIPHSEHAVIIMQNLANFFVEEARHSDHHFPSRKKEAAALIYNYSPVYTDSYFIQEYCF